MNKKKFTDEEVKKVFERIRKGTPKSVINKEYNVNPSYFSRAFKRLNLDAKRYCSRTEIIGDYFDTIDSEDKAYLLGILFTDGYIKKPTEKHNHQTVIGLEVEETDKMLIQYLNSKIKPKGTIMRIVCKNYGQRKDGTIPIHSRTTVYSDWMANTLLNRYGFTYSKSQNTEINLTNNIPNKYIFSFIRGLIDGDGTVAVRSRSKNTISYYIGFVSISKHVVDQLENIIRTHCPFDIKIKREEQVSENYLTRYIFKITKRRDVLWLASKMYENFEFCLERKFSRLQELSRSTLLYSNRHSQETIDYANTVLTGKVMFTSSIESNF